jgi:hypothetical protein
MIQQKDVVREGGNRQDAKPDRTMQKQVTFTRQAIRTPRAVAVAGIIFSVLFTTSMVLIRLALPEQLDIHHPTSLYHIRALRYINYCRSQVINYRKLHFSLSTCPAYGMADAHSIGRISCHG